MNNILTEKEINNIIEINNKLPENIKKNYFELKIKGFLPAETCNQIIKDLIDNQLKEYELTKNDILIIITKYTQKSSSNVRAVENLKIKHADKNGKEFSFEGNTLLESIHKFEPEGTIRQLARSLASTIAEISIALDIPGDLSIAIKSSNSETDFSVADLA